MSNVNFNNTEKAFAYKSNAELLRDYQIFRLINQGWLVSWGTRLAAGMMDAGWKEPVALGLRPTVYAVFCGGDSLLKAEQKIHRLHSYNVKSILDYGVEGKESEADFDRTANAIKEAILFARKEKAVDIVCSKFTGLLPFALLEKLHSGQPLSIGEKVAYTNARTRIYDLAQLAYDNDVSLFVDAEESWIQKPLDDLTFELMQQFNKKKPIIYNTVQLYRKDRLDFFRSEVARAQEQGFIYAAKLVRGAYMEKEAARAAKMGYENPIQRTKSDTDRDYDEAVRFALQHIERVAVCIATHNEDSTQLAVRIMEEMNLPNAHPHIHFSQLLGMSDHVSFNMADAGFHVHKYMPYGPVIEVIPYLIRRAQENTSVSGQMGRELKLLKEEVKRRRLWTL